MELSFTADELEQIKEIQKKYPQKDASIMPVLWFAQKKFGWISKDLIIYISQILNVSPSKVEGVVTFYTMFFKKPMGRYHIQVCTNVSCMLNKGVELYKYISNKLGIENMQVTEDGRFSLEEVECLGACGKAPIVAINENYYENMTIEKIDMILLSLYEN